MAATEECRNLLECATYWEAAELRSVKKTILARYGLGRSLFQKPLFRLGCKIRKQLYDRLTAEWKAEASNSVGGCTRILLSMLMNQRMMTFESENATRTGRNRAAGKNARDDCAGTDPCIGKVAEMIRKEVLVKQ